jgi:hypothetical protein
MTSGLITTELHIMKTLTLKWGEAAGVFLSIEVLMRYLAEIHGPLRDKIDQLIKEKKKDRFIHYWDCNPEFLTCAIVAIFGQALTVGEKDLISKFPSIRGKFNHGNFIELIKIMGVQPRSRTQTSPSTWKELESGKIYESVYAMERLHIFEKLRQYSEEVREALTKIIQQ